MGRRASRVRGDGWCGEVLADSNLDSVLRVFPMDNYRKDEAVGGQSGTDLSELDWSNVRSSITRVKRDVPIMLFWVLTGYSCLSRPRFKFGFGFDTLIMPSYA
jgi:hypothetical protein